MARIPVTIITGFLGSGKTTLLNALLRQPDLRDAAVIINEFGEIGLDHHLVESADGQVVQLENGCLCCTIRGDLVTTLQDLYHRRAAGKVQKFGKAVIETTGLADPVPVMQVVLSDPMVSHVYELDGVVTTVDGVLGDVTLDGHEEAVRQVAVADRLLLTKTDLLTDGPDSLARLKGRLAKLNPAAPIVEVTRGNVPADLVFGSGLYDPASKVADVGTWLNDDAFRRGEGHAHSHDVNRHDAGIRAFCIEQEEPFTLRGLEMLFEALAGLEEGTGLEEGAGLDGGKLLRVKGIVRVAERPDEPAVVQGARNIFHTLEWLKGWPPDMPEGKRISRIVFITQNFDRSAVDEILALVGRMTGMVKAAP